MPDQCILDLPDDILYNILSMVAMDGYFGGTKGATISCRCFRDMCEEHLVRRSVTIRDAVRVVLGSKSISEICSALASIRALADLGPGEPDVAYLFGIFISCSPSMKGVAEGLVYLNRFQSLSLVEYLKIRKVSFVREFPIKAVSFLLEYGTRTWLMEFFGRTWLVDLAIDSWNGRYLLFGEWDELRAHDAIVHGCTLRFEVHEGATRRMKLYLEPK